MAARLLAHPTRARRLSTHCWVPFRCYKKYMYVSSKAQQQCAPLMKKFQDCYDVKMGLKAPAPSDEPDQLAASGNVPSSR